MDDPATDRSDSSWKTVVLEESFPKSPRSAGDVAGIDSDELWKSAASIFAALSTSADAAAC